MTLSDFIESDLDGLIDDWIEYARTISAEDVRLDDAQLRNSARELLTGIAADMRESQTTEQQRQKSHGQRLDRDSAFNRIARGHADDRQSHGFDINGVVAEYRALRASVLRRWQEACQLDATAVQEMIRFNEAVDQMIAESVREFSSITERIRDLFTGVLAHDLRSPVGAILNSTRAILADQNLSPTSLRAGTNLQRSAIRVKLLVDDLFVFTSTRLGNALPVQFDDCDVERICHDAADEVCTTHPDAHIRVKARGRLTATCDAERMLQLIVNLVANGVQHGSGRVGVEAVGDNEWITIAVSNGGQPIPARALPTLFDPLTRAQPSPESRKASPGMGLGLYICRCIAHAHNGTIEVESSESGTVFTVKIPRVAT
ncbi:sensor histidine kinase [Paraburkholderia caribensis]|uniref:sensor histidine kinase n=1 Tax=Paraburkholderia caribensis TaxID=75105 RepID=UPI000722A08D|nr:sensor histidine kinase [Paraburkholderia caribensis]ALP62410.1 histidine kinase [Paraburkholderia caribensis]AUT52364.1 sensor histidine kinase [Paraburkholderia caribensis]